MTEPKRLFDCLQFQLKRKPLPDMLAAKENGKWKTYSTEEVITTVDNLSAGLLNLGIQCGDMTAESRDKIAILSKNRPEWVMLDLAVQQTGAVLTEVIHEALTTNGYAPKDISLFIPHQANLRIIDAVGERMKIDPAKVYKNVDRYGNTSAASVPIALDESRRAGRFGPGDLLMMSGFGGGLAWGTALMRW
jgi:acyl-coenzyme A synthetase/AMP-(fatty) acid ligase